MSVVQFNNIYKQFSGEYLLKDISFTIEDKDRIGLVGLNGTGKSTLIKMLLGMERIDPDLQNNIGNISMSNATKVGYLSQNHNFSDEMNSVYEEMMEVFIEEHKLWHEIQKINSFLAVSEGEELEKNLELLSDLTTKYEAKNGYEIEYKIRQILTGLELEGYQEQIIKDLSGGEKTRVALAKLLLQEPDLLVLDEPTNHLDLVSIEWLEEYLKKYGKAFLLVSHDRIFLDNVCNKIYEIENKKLYKYDGNLSRFIFFLFFILKGELKRYEKEQEKVKKMEEYIDRFRAGIKARQAQGRQKILDRIEQMDDPIFNPQRMRLKFEVASSTGENVLQVRNVSKSFDGNKVLNNINFDLYKGERVGIIGKNGIGKSTLLKIIMEKISKDKGEIAIGSRVKIGYYDQDHSALHGENTVLQEINTSLNLTQEYLRTLAGGFLFSGEDVEKRIDKLSGGEKVRVSFLKLYMEKANLLILDEPTNHLDIYSIEVLEDALEDYEGTLLVVSHNRHFLDVVCNTIYYLDENGLKKFKGNYEDYKASLKNSGNNEQGEEKEEKKVSYQEQKEMSRKIAKLKKDIEKLEEEMEMLSKDKEIAEKKYYEAGKTNDMDTIVEMQEKIEKIDELEISKLEEWEEKSNELAEHQ